MLFPKRAYRSTFNRSISSRTVPSLSSAADTDSSILLVDADNKSCTSSRGNDTKVSPILYLCVESAYMHLMWLNYRTVSSHLRSPARARWRFLLGLLCLSALPVRLSHTQGWEEDVRTALIFRSSSSSISR